MILGSYYLTMVKPGMEQGEGKVFRDENEALMAYQEGVVGLHAPIKVKMSKKIGGKEISKLLDTTVGRNYFQQAHSSGFGLCGPEKQREYAGFGSGFPGWEEKTG